MRQLWDLALVFSLSSCRYAGWAGHFQGFLSLSCWKVTLENLRQVVPFLALQPRKVTFGEAEGGAFGGQIIPSAEMQVLAAH